MGLIGGMARTAVVAGTATAVPNRVSRRQAARWEQQSYQQQAVGSQDGAGGLGDLPVALRQRLRDPARADGQIAAGFTGLRNARERKRRLGGDDPSRSCARGGSGQADAGRGGDDGCPEAERGRKPARHRP